MKTQEQKPFKMLATPKAGVVVYDPNDHRILPPEGKVVTGNKSYWVRQREDGAVALASEPEKSPKKTATPSSGAPVILENNAKKLEPHTPSVSGPEGGSK